MCSGKFRVNRCRVALAFIIQGPPKFEWLLKGCNQSRLGQQLAAGRTFLFRLHSHQVPEVQCKYGIPLLTDSRYVYYQYILNMNEEPPVKNFSPNQNNLT